MSLALRLGVIVDSEAKLALIKTAVGQVGQRIDYSALLACDDNSGVSATVLAELEQIQNLDAWVVDLNHTGIKSSDVEKVLLSAPLVASIPVIVCDSSEMRDGAAERLQWLNRLITRLQRVQGEVNLQYQRPASSIWLLAASTGGPNAVSEFLQALPNGLDVAFVYLQHINEGYSPALLNMVSKVCGYSARLAQQGDVLEAGTVTLVDPAAKIEVQNNGTLMRFDEPWKGCYRPSIDQLAANLARTRAFRGGIIIFSGMGDDGAASSRLIAQNNGLVWAQEPDSCVVDSMPQAALQTGCVQRTGSPGELAQALAQHLHLLQERQSHESSATH
ncbi:chemotaxis protein CheB [Gilvimarinus sp. DA14]|uniref:chemotaxis protein CheB n=1 Tax=Gilvimarinus sp. DA14 TaxID=2956798 RepID=UPI0020B7C3D8|nr:chemotaxis protein CheB [Gilvimarinus sp. DA14]UTF59296.1 chemotaxis protein CheB [Gilvimarinus sp. DA14]